MLKYPIFFMITLGSTEFPKKCWNVSLFQFLLNKYTRSPKTTAMWNYHIHTVKLEAQFSVGHYLYRQQLSDT